MRMAAGPAEAEGIRATRPLAVPGKIYPSSIAMIL